MIFYRRWQPVKALSFDLDDTLYFNQPIIERTEQQLVDYFQNLYPQCRNSDSQFWQQAKRKAIEQDPQLLLDFTLMRRGTLRYGFQQSGLQGQQLENAVEDGFNEFYRLRSDFTVPIEVTRILANLAKAYPLVAITNGNVNLDKIGIADYFSHRFHGGIKQTLKPHRAMFDLTRQALNLNASEILHVGDSFTNDVMGGIKAGFKTAWYAEDREMLIKQEAVSLLPDIQIHQLADLEFLLP
ncbi:HAD-IA family hydrolase [Neptunicella sp. SCSIO 80796]|uniref:HAD-IA family hydrolase n=1 Tax=Neptunicella plasticusilytica TaxID=3117012 RepID=UPI003A4D6E68